MQSRIMAPVLCAASVALLAAPAIRALDLASGDWKFSVDGNINVHYIASSCQSAASAKAIATVGGACVGDQSGSNVSSVSNGLLPAALTFAVATTQNGIDLGAHFGLYPGIATNDGGSPNLEINGGNNLPLGTTGLDVRQVYLTFGNKDMGTFALGRNFGLFGFDAIINDMTLPGVGVAGSMATRAPANTSLGSIGFGYIYCDTLAQMNYTTPDFSGLNLTLGIFEPVNPLVEAAGAVTNKSTPGFHGKLAYSTSFDAAKLYLSGTFISQKQGYVAGSTTGSYNSTGYDATAKLDVAGFSLLGSYYHGDGMGTTALFTLADSAAGVARTSDGYLVQATYTVKAVKFGVNYGVSQLDFANGADQLALPNLLKRNSKVTGGVYYSLTKNLTVLGEYSSAQTQAHNGDENKSNSFNIGAFLAF